MSTSKFHITEHILPCQHIREYPGATATTDEDVLELKIKQYTPLDNLDPRPGDITIISGHGSGIPKEAYEPMWDEFLKFSQNSNFKIRSIWIADVAQMGASAEVNKERLGNDPHWFDHSRDLLCMVNHFRRDMPRPIVGIGHSMSCTQLVFLAHMHPRLFSSLLLVEPGIGVDSFGGFQKLWQMTTFRKDYWPTLAEAEKDLMKYPLYANIEKRVWSCFLANAFRTTSNPSGVTLATPKHQEAFTTARPNYSGIGVDTPASRRERWTHPDINMASKIRAPFYRSENQLAFSYLETLRPPVLYITGSQSRIQKGGQQAKRMEVTGTGHGGSGGAAIGAVEEVVLDGGHMLPLERVESTARKMVDWLDKESKIWQEADKEFLERWRGRTLRDKQTMGKDWLKMMKNWDGVLWTSRPKL